MASAAIDHMEARLNTNLLSFKSFGEWNRHLKEGNGPDAPVYFIPTMGALHEGHSALIRKARTLAGESGSLRPLVVVSVYVNPTQFNEQQDLDHYPRTPEEDLARAMDAGADGVVFPDAAEMYPEGVPKTVDRVDYGALTSRLEGAMRPGHFDGVVAVVRRLFQLVRPTKALFGEKDWQQLAVIRRLAAMEFPEVEIVPVPTVREWDGLAKSSRNIRISDADRSGAAALHAQLMATARSPDPGADCVRAREALERTGFEVEYFEVADGATLEQGPGDGSGMRVLAAVRYSGVRLIDNVACLP